MTDPQWLPVAPPVWHAQAQPQMLGKDDEDTDEDEDDDDAEDQEDDGDDKDDEDDPDKDKSPEDLKAELKRVRAGLTKRKTSGAKARARIQELETELAKKGGDDDEVDAKVSEKAREIENAANERIKRSEVRGALRGLGLSDSNLRLLIGQVNLGDLDIDDKGEVDGIDDVIDDLKSDYPDLFKVRGTRKRVAGDDDSSGRDAKKKLTASERQAAVLDKYRR